MFPSQVTLPIQLASNIWLPALIRSGQLKITNVISLLLPAVVRDVLYPDNMAAGPASYGLTDSMGRMHGDAQFAGSSSVPAHVEMMGLMGMGNNPMVGATVACAVAVYESINNQNKKLLIYYEQLFILSDLDIKSCLGITYSRTANIYTISQVFAI